MSAVWATQAMGLCGGGLSFVVIILTLYTDSSFKMGFRSTSS